MARDREISSPRPQAQYGVPTGNFSANSNENISYHQSSESSTSSWDSNSHSSGQTVYSNPGSPKASLMDALRCQDQRVTSCSDSQLPLPLNTNPMLVIGNGNHSAYCHAHNFMMCEGGGPRNKNLRNELLNLRNANAPRMLLSQQHSGSVQGDSCVYFQSAGQSQSSSVDLSQLADSSSMGMSEGMRSPPEEGEVSSMVAMVGGGQSDMECDMENMIHEDVTSTNPSFEISLVLPDLDSELDLVSIPLGSNLMGGTSIQLIQPENQLGSPLPALIPASRVASTPTSHTMQGMSAPEQQSNIEDELEIVKMLNVQLKPPANLSLKESVVVTEGHIQSPMMEGFMLPSPTTACYPMVPVETSAPSPFLSATQTPMTPCASQNLRSCIEDEQFICEISVWDDLPPFQHQNPTQAMDFSLETHLKLSQCCDLQVTTDAKAVEFDQAFYQTLPKTDVRDRQLVLQQVTNVQAAVCTLSSKARLSLWGRIMDVLSEVVISEKVLHSQSVPLPGSEVTERRTSGVRRSSFGHLFHAWWMLLLLLKVGLVSGQSEVFVTPRAFVAIPGGSATFFCSTSPLSNDDIVNVTWLVQGRNLEESGLDNVRSPGFGILLFSPVSSSDNMTEVQCSTVHVSGLSSLSAPSRLLIQDVPPAVSSLRIQVWNSTLSLTWEPPFTLDITGVDSDIIDYCVDLINSTSSVTLHSECGITETEFTYPIPADANCHQYDFTVTAVNIVGRGEPATVTYTGLQTTPSIDRYELVNVTTRAGDIPNFIYVFTMTEFVCGGNLTLVNLDTGSSVQEFSFVREDDDKFLLSANLSFSRYNATIEAYNGAGPDISRLELNTHPITDANATAGNSGDQITVNTDYNDRINDTGALYVFIHDMLVGSTLVALDRTVSLSHNLPSSGGNFTLYAYDINDDGMLLSGDSYPASTERLKEGLSIQLNFSHLENCTASRVSSLIYVNCEYSRDSLAIGFQAVVYNKEKIRVNQTADRQTSTTVEVEENGQYLVFVIPVLPETGITNTSLEYMSMILDQQDPTVATDPVPSNNTSAHVVVVVVVGIGLLLLAAVVVTVVIFGKCTRNKRDKEKKPVQNEDGKSAVEIEGTNVRNDGDHPAKGVAGVCSVGTDDEANAQTLPTDINEDENLGYQSECAHVLINLDAELPQTPSHVVIKCDDIADTMKTCASKWKSIAEGLGFHEYEIEELEEKPCDDILGSVIRNWSQWRPGDSRGSKSCPNMEDLEAVLRNIGYPDVAKKLKAYKSSVILPHIVCEEITL